MYKRFLIISCLFLLLSLPLTFVHKQWREFETCHCPTNQTYFEKLNYKLTLNPAIDYALCWQQLGFVCYRQPFFFHGRLTLSQRVVQCQQSLPQYILSIIFHCKRSFNSSSSC
jgi:hypothetical protein